MTTIGFAGRFKLEAVNAETGERRVLAPWFNNLITDAGLNRIGTGPIGGYCHVGTGTAAPAVTDTALAAKLAHTTSAISGVTSGSATMPYYGSRVQVFRFGVGVASGNLSEVGVGYSATALFSRTLIKDSSGNPTTITVLPSEYLDVTYELRMYAPVADVPFSVVISGVTYTGVVRAADATTFSGSTDPWYGGYLFGSGASLGAVQSRAYNGAIGAANTVPSGAVSFLGSPSNNAYSNNSLQLTGTVTAALGAGNLAGGISALVIYTTLGAFQMSFSPAIPKDATKVLSVGITLSWARKVI